MLISDIMIPNIYTGRLNVNSWKSNAWYHDPSRCTHATLIILNYLRLVFQVASSFGDQTGTSITIIIP